jgi:high frequency lysogenization protein
MAVTDNQVLALAGCAQAATWVHDLARNGSVPDGVLTQAIDSILELSPDSAGVAVGPCDTGLLQLLQQLSPGSNEQRPVGLYLGQIIALQDQLRNKPDTVEELGTRLRQLSRKSNLFALDQENLVQAISDIYLDTISTLSLRIQVTGNARWLSQAKIQARIRVLLLYGIRCAWLWRQEGGRKWHFLLARRQMVRQARSLHGISEIV